MTRRTLSLALALLALAPPALAAGDSPKARLAGTWTTRLSDGTRQHIAFHGGRFLVYVTMPDVARMKVAYHGHRVTFWDSDTCPGRGSYRWRIARGTLRFTLQGADPCHRAQLLPDKAWRR